MELEPVGEVSAKAVVRGADATPVQGLRCQMLTWMAVSAAAPGWASNG